MTGADVTMLADRTQAVDADPRRALTAGRCYFILTCARSGSTALTRLLDTAEDAACVVEPAPNLTRETRLAMEGRLGDPAPLLEATVIPRVLAGLNTARTYGEKNLTYGPFIGPLHRALGCRFVFIRRDGRDVVRSLIDWHEQKFGTVYRECVEPGNLSGEALLTAGRLPVLHDHSDFSRPRPQPGHPLHDRWMGLSRLEMSAYYWATINDMYAEGLSSIPARDVIEIDFTSPCADDVRRVMAALGLTPRAGADLEGMLRSRINSLADRRAPAGTFPAWPDWCSGRRRTFTAIAGEAMRRFGYDRGPAERWRPAGMAEPRAAQRLESGGPALAWLTALIEHKVRGTVAAQGEDVAAWLRGRVDRARWEGAPREAALVVTSGLLEATHDIDLLVASTLRRAGLAAFLMLAPGSGEVPEHLYRFDPQARTFRNTPSVAALARAVREAGGEVLEEATALLPTSPPSRGAWLLARGVTGGSVA